MAEETPKAGYNTVFTLSKYSYRLIYLRIGALYFGVEGVRSDRPEQSGGVFLVLSNRQAGSHTKALGHGPTEGRSLLLQPSPPLRFSQKAKSFPFIFSNYLIIMINNNGHKRGRSVFPEMSAIVFAGRNSR